MAHHYILKCEHGVMQGQCRCPGPDKAVRRTKNCNCPPGTPKDSKVQQPEPEATVQPAELPPQQRGLERRYRVERVDGRDAPGEKHHGDRLFVLDLDHDPHALGALAAYIVSARAQHPALAADLERLLAEHTGKDSYRVEAKGGFATLVDNQTERSMLVVLDCTPVMSEQMARILAPIINALAEAEDRAHPLRQREPAQPQEA